MESHLRAFQERLSAMEGGLQRLTAETLRLEAEASSLRQHMTIMCLSTVVDLTHAALEKAKLVTSSEEKLELLHRIQQNLRGTEEPRASSTMAAYDMLRCLHMECHSCGSQVRCPIASALLILRDLVVLTVSIGHGPLDPKKLKALLAEALWNGCRRDVLDKVECSQLTLAYSKVLTLGRTRVGLEEKVRSIHMHGPHLTDEEVDHIFIVYNTCSLETPDYQSKNKQENKHKKKPLQQAQEEEVEAGQAVEETWQTWPDPEADFWQSTLACPPFCPTGFEEFIPSEHNGMLHSTMPSFGCVKCHLEDQDGRWTTSGYMCIHCCSKAASSSS